MGGGIGIAGHADFRFATPTVRFAMPEAAIGFVSDVGVNAILARAPLHRALLFLMSGSAVGAGDARALGLTDCIVKPSHAAGPPRRRSGPACEAAHVETAIVALMQSETIEPEEAKLCADADRLAEALELETAAEIVAGIEELEDGSARSTGRCSARARRRASRRSSSAITRRGTGRTSMPCSRSIAGSRGSWRGSPILPKGVRAVLVDKDNAADVVAGGLRGRRRCDALRRAHRRLRFSTS